MTYSGLSSVALSHLFHERISQSTGQDSSSTPLWKIQKSSPPRARIWGTSTSLLSLQYFATHSDRDCLSQLGYWYHPGSSAASLNPILFFHGISGTYGPTPFLLYQQWATSRPMFIPEFPYLTMRLYGPRAILSRKETVRGVRGMLRRHGFEVPRESRADDDDAEVEEEEEEWRRGKVILMGHSLGSGPCAWILRDAVSRSLSSSSQQSQG